MPCTALLLAAGLALASPSPLPDDTPVHLGIALAATHTEELAALRRGQQDPSSPDYRRWLTPEEYGARFGQPAARYAAISAWLRDHGFAVTESPNRTFIGALGTAGQVTKLAGVHLRHVAGQPAGVHVPDREPRFPPEIASAILHVAGLDTRVRYHHLLAESDGWTPALGPQDLRRFYDLAPLLDAGYVGQRQQLVVLGEAEPPATAISPQAIDYFLQNVSDARAPLILDTLPNPNQDFDPGGGGNQEFEPDVELQSVGAPGAESITLVISPASEVFITGANEIVSHLSSATAVSVSLGICEEYEDPGEAASFEQYLIQGTSEGQTWSAATGDSGSDDCQDGQTESVDWPASLPEIVAMGGSQITNPVFDANNAITSYQQEVVWNTDDPQEAAAAGGGISELYGVPAYQDGLVDGGRSVPDLVLLAGNPGVAADSSNPFLPLANNYNVAAPMAAQLSSFEGTSAASPLSAGFFALIASRVGCRLGDPHVALYNLGRGQFDGGPIVYNAITQGTVSIDGVPGPSAGVGYNSASGWGSFDVAAMAAAWPPCPAPDGGDAGYDFAGGIQPEANYSQCAFIACDAGSPCVTLPEGPSSCEIPCSATGACGTDYLCTPGTIFADAGLCVPGCATDADCAAQDGGVCNTCEETCVPPGAADAGVGAACEGPFQCPTSGLCLTLDMNYNQWPAGYCTSICNTTGTSGACSCPSGSVCNFAMGLCMQTCPTPGTSGCRSGYVCQPDGDGTSSCQIPCSVSQGFDTCTVSETPTLACDQASGVCGGPVPLPDAGADAGPAAQDAGPAAQDAGPAAQDAGPAAQDAGLATQDAGPAASDAGLDAGTPPPAADAGASDAGEATSKAGGCSCGAGAGAGAADLPLLLGALLALSRRRRGLARV